MIEDHQHIIHQQVIEAKLNNEDEAKTFHQKISALCDFVIPNLLNDLCSDLSLGEDLLQIQHLEIDLGPLPSENWEPELLRRCSIQLKKQLAIKKKQAIEVKHVDFSNKSISHDQILKDDQQTLTSFISFLTTGNAPGVGINSNFRQYEKQIIKSLSDKPVQTAFKSFWKENRQAGPYVIERLSKQFSTSFVKELLSFVWGISVDQWKAIREEFKSLVNELNPGLNHSSKSLNYYFIKVLMEYFINIKSDTFNYNKLKQVCKTNWKPLIMDIPTNKNIRKNPNTEAYLTEEELKISIEKESIKSPDYFIENAGLIIVASFLPPFFKKLKLADTHEFYSAEHQEKAILLSQYLVTGALQSPEHLLPLNKLLCGWPLDRPLIQALKLTSTEKQEAGHLLQAIINHWGKIGKSSIAALQETFLQRKATLKYQEGLKAWHINVEYKSGIDIFTAKIPWTISMVKLPWMKEKIHVEWV